MIENAPVTCRMEGAVLIATVANPPVNALSRVVRAGLLDAIARASADRAVAAIVIACDGKTFCAGADVPEFDRSPEAPLLPDLCYAIEASDKPVVAAIHGTALGGGLEVALACHYRLAADTARFGMPEVKLGLIPGAGGTQRLPRLVGLEAAAQMILSGDPIGAGEAKTIGLIDGAVPDGQLAAAAVVLAEAVSCVLPPPRLRDRLAAPADAKLDAVVHETVRRSCGMVAPTAALRALRAAASLPFAEGLRLERDLFLELKSGSQSRALRHAFFAERNATKVPGIERETPRLPVNRVGLVGAGTMGSGIATAFLLAGFEVTLLDLTRDAVAHGSGLVGRNLEGALSRGRISPEEKHAMSERLQLATDFAELTGCDLTIEAVFEDMAIKQDVLAKLDRHMRADAILATNTSYLDVNHLAKGVSNPERVLGLHFFSPAHIMKLLEVVRGDRTSPQVLASALEVARRLGKVAVVAGVCEGFIGNRMLAQRRLAAWELLRQGVRYDRIDAAHAAFGMPMGPFRMSDLAGVDVGWHRDPQRIESLRDALCAAGRVGEKVGKGFYDYAQPGRPAFSPDAEAIIDGFHGRVGAPEQGMAEAEILSRTLYPMINEGARILAEGIATRASDIDVVWVNGYGWPAYRGGPMFWAEEVGLDRVVEGLGEQEREVAPLLEDLARRGESILGLK